MVLDKKTTCGSERILFFQEGWYLTKKPHIAQRGYYFSKKDGTWQEDHILLRRDTIFPRR
jgi:hypothetical protein